MACVELEDVAELKPIRWKPVTSVPVWAYQRAPARPFVQSEWAAEYIYIPIFLKETVFFHIFPKDTCILFFSSDG